MAKPRGPKESGQYGTINTYTLAKRPRIPTLKPAIDLVSPVHEQEHQHHTHDRRRKIIGHTLDKQVEPPDQKLGEDYEHDSDETIAEVVE